MNLEKEIVSKETNYVTIGYSSSNMKLEDFRNALEKLEKKAKENGLTDLKVEISYDNGDCDNLATYTMCLRGSRVETEEEWHKRLEDTRARSKRELETAQAIVARSTKYEEKIRNIDAALETSTLRCEKCKTPCSYTTFMSDWKKPKRICNECCNKLIQSRNK